MSRRLALFALLAAVAVVLLLGAAAVAQGQGGVTASAVPGDVVEAAVSLPSGDLSSAAVAGDADDESPCVVRADCAGALVLGGLGLVLALPAMMPSIGGAALPAVRVDGRQRLLRSTLWASRLHRPPQPS